MAQIMNQLSDIDYAHQLLQQNGRAMYFRDLITKALELSGRRIYSLAPAIAEVHTRINMDSRFIHMGKGMWGLAEWTPQQHKLSAAEDVAPKSAADLRRAKLLEEIQADLPPAEEEPEETFTENE